MYNQNIYDQLTRYDVDTDFRNSCYPPNNACLICGNGGTHKIIPKKAMYNSIEIEDRGFVCESCLKRGLLDRTRYGIRELK